MQNKLKGWITPNSITKDPYDKIQTSDATGNEWFKDVYKERYRSYFENAPLYITPNVYQNKKQ